MCQPYFYIIEDVQTNQLYAGVKYAADADPDLLMTEGGYLTSSSVVAERVEQDGPSRFAVRKVRLMTDKDHALRYEHRFLWKVRAPSNPRFLNQNYGRTPNQKGKQWVTNGETNKLVYNIPEGFWKGKTQVSGPEHGFYGKPKNYKTTQAVKLEKGHTPWNKGVTGGTNTLKGRSWTLVNGKRVWSN